MTTEKKRSPKKKPASKKSTSHDKKKKNKNKKNYCKFISDQLPKICFFIGVCDLVHALYFTISAMILLVESFSFFAVLAVISVFFWVVIVITLIVGLWKRKPVLIKCWLLFSIVGFGIDILFLIYGIMSSFTIDWDRLQEFSIIFIGICHWFDKKPKPKKSKSGSKKKKSKK
nr:uncharacterized protein LOC108119064 [Drosophila bipectinata]